MSSTATLKQLHTELEEIKQEVSILRSFAIGIAGQDSEGEYRPEFVNEILRARLEKPAYTFRNKRNFLAELRLRKPS